MQLKVYNTYSRQKEDFVPLKPDHIGLYVCGPTVYDFAHIGNARPVVVFDILNRLLRHLYPKVTYVRNITDVDDKINAAAKASGESIRTITERTTQAYNDDMAALDALVPDVAPRATEHINEMIRMIEQLIDQGHAYAADGHVLFAVKTFTEYGKLSRRNQDELLAGARVEVAPYKKDAGDFVLWKPSDEETPGWESPWGRGRPGWHIECSAMSEKYLGKTFDIHGGGIDLSFPHHENELAQSCCANKTSYFAKYWMHNGHLTVNGEKMSKSLGNFYTVRELLEEFKGEALRYMLMSAHYRQPLDLSKDLIRQCHASLDRLYGAMRGLTMTEASIIHPDVFSALLDDMNVPLALSHLHDLASQINKASDFEEKQKLASIMKASGVLLGILQQDPDLWFKGEDNLNTTEIEELISHRNQARANRDFGEADRLRQHLLDMGVVLEDSASGTTWRRA
ncbi:cysteine--tRNA ligase [Candidatus Odyssella acanthamoebae]|uniref:Cysteine--tRNA ligase n=1 Tax=Candidatus Odyssella acanthamoebae TaxID=91604 RepID=A0A077AYV5_9PROT|nr:cysteine--tRNA ligase [Candidatus Paracaedibacter acanthamoebae]AIK97184.1 cysteinyl-tRNA synthetase [Candidatus Paracaedibacter acanthamoebae]